MCRARYCRARKSPSFSSGCAAVQPRLACHHTTHHRNGLPPHCPPSCTIHMRILAITCGFQTLRGVLSTLQALTERPTDGSDKELAQSRLGTAASVASHGALIAFGSGALHLQPTTAALWHAAYLVFSYCPATRKLVIQTLNFSELLFAPVSRKLPRRPVNASAVAVQLPPPRPARMQPDVMPGWCLDPTVSGAVVVPLRPGAHWTRWNGERCICNGTVTCAAPPPGRSSLSSSQKSHEWSLRTSYALLGAAAFAATPLIALILLRRAAPPNMMHPHDAPSWRTLMTLLITFPMTFLMTHPHGLPHDVGISPRCVAGCGAYDRVSHSRMRRSR
mgnify:CR=1 FL=1